MKSKNNGFSFARNNTFHENTKTQFYCNCSICIAFHLSFSREGNCDQCKREKTFEFCLALRMYAICRRDVFDILVIPFINVHSVLLCSFLFSTFTSFLEFSFNEKCLRLKSLSNILLFLFFSTIVILKLCKSHKSSCDMK